MRVPAAIALMLVSIGCSSAAPSSPYASDASQLTSATTGAKRGSLGTLRTRDRELALFASPAGLEVSFRDASGRLSQRMNLDALRATDPDLYELCRSGVASKRPYLDATWTPRTSEPSWGGNVDADRPSPH